MVAGDRFFIKPLLRALTVSQSAYVLALAQGSVRLVEVSGDLPAAAVKVHGPAQRRGQCRSARRRSWTARPAGASTAAKGQKVRLRQYARQVDHALRGRLGGSETPLILAAHQPLDAIFRSVCSYPHLVAETLALPPEESSDADLAQASRAVLDRLHAAELASLRDQFDARSAQGRTTTDLAQASKAATFGAVQTLFVDINDIVPGHIDDDGAVHFDDADAGHHGIVDQIASRALASGARVLGVRRADVPGGGSLAAILRYEF